MGDGKLESNSPNSPCRPVRCFDTGKAEVKPESAPALQEIVKLLKQDASSRSMSWAIPTMLVPWPRISIFPGGARRPLCECSRLNMAWLPTGSFGIVDDAAAAIAGGDKYFGDVFEALVPP